MCYINYNLLTITFVTRDMWLNKQASVRNGKSYQIRLLPTEITTFLAWFYRLKYGIVETDLQLQCCSFNPNP